MKFAELEGKEVDVQQGDDRFKAVLREIRPIGVFLEVLDAQEGTKYSSGEYLVFSNSVPLVIKCAG